MKLLFLFEVIQGQHHGENVRKCVSTEYDLYVRNPVLLNS